MTQGLTQIKKAMLRYLNTAFLKRMPLFSRYAYFKKMS